MSNQVIEWAPFKIKGSVTEVDLIKASNRFQAEFLNKQEGFIRRELIRKGDGEYVDLVHWKSNEDAERAMSNAEASEAIERYFSVMSANGDDGGNSVLHFQSIRTY